MLTKTNKTFIMKKEKNFTTEFDIKSWNTNQNPTDLHDYVVTGTERKGVGIACLQEFRIDNFSKNNQYSIKEYDNNQYHVLFNGMITGIFTFSVGISSPSIGMARVPKKQNYGTLVIWNCNTFSFCNTRTPSYFHFQRDELGMRTTPWVTLCTKNFKFLNIMSVHGHAQNEIKKNVMFNSIFKDVSECNISTLIMGDFNYNPPDLNKLVPKRLRFKPFIGITHVNSLKNETWCIDHVITNKLVKVSNLQIHGIDQEKKCMKSRLADKNHDHGILSFTFHI